MKVGLLVAKNNYRVVSEVDYNKLKVRRESEVVEIVAFDNVEKFRAKYKEEGWELNAILFVERLPPDILGF